MAAPTVVTLQPQYVVTGPNVSRAMWQTGLMDCCTDCGVCCCGMFCYPCLGCQVAGDMNECCLCGTSVALRTLYRTRYNIPGSICSDCCITFWCPVCSVCQIKRDINKRREMGIFWSVPPFSLHHGGIVHVLDPSGMNVWPQQAAGSPSSPPVPSLTDAVETAPPAPPRKVAEDCP
ncbi:placenta-specific gene 8 protein-like [Mergus octosetaceus]